jgi:hypothetical protein
VAALGFTVPASMLALADKVIVLIAAVHESAFATSRHSRHSNISTIGCKADID